MASVLVAWINDRDLEASGPGGMVESRIHRVVEEEFYARVYLFSAFKKSGRNYKKWLSSVVATPLEFERVKVLNLYDYNEVWESTLQALTDCRQHMDEDEIEWSFLLGGDSAVMDAVMIHLAHTVVPAELLQWSKSAGLQVIDVAPEKYPNFATGEAPTLGTQTTTTFHAAANLDSVEHRSPEMTLIHKQARHLATLDVPVLLTGEAGTGREFVARAIHKASSRTGSFISVDCESLEPNGQAAALFGADGGMKKASGGTLLLRSVDRLSRSTQSLLQRTMRDGRSAALRGPLDVRFMATISGSPTEILNAGELLPVLFHTLAIGLLQVPPLRDRPTDIAPFVAQVLMRVSQEMQGERVLSDEAMALVEQEPWPGNHVELKSTLRRAAVLTEHVIEIEHIRRSIFRSVGRLADLPEGFDIQRQLDDMARHYVKDALSSCEGNKTKAAKMLGLNNYQTLTNWMRRLEVEST